MRRRQGAHVVGASTVEWHGAKPSPSYICDGEHSGVDLLGRGNCQWEREVGTYLIDMIRVEYLMRKGAAVGQNMPALGMSGMLWWVEGRGRSGAVEQADETCRIRLE
jgi:hypothetical protein